MRLNRRREKITAVFYLSGDCSYGVIKRLFHGKGRRTGPPVFPQDNTVKEQKGICQGGFHPKDEIPPDRLEVIALI